MAREWGLVVDYRDLNPESQHGVYSLPLIDNLPQKQQKRRIFSVVDLKHGYHQMPLKEESRDCTAMSTPIGLMRCKQASKQEQVKWAKSQVHCGASDSNDNMVDDTYGCEGQSHKVWARKPIVVGGNKRCKWQTQVSKSVKIAKNIPFLGAVSMPKMCMEGHLRWNQLG